MRQLIRTFVRASLAGLAIAATLSQAQQPAKIPIEAFFERPALVDAKLSPNGKLVALQIRPKGGRVQLVVMDTATMSAKPIVRFSDIDVQTVNWVNDSRLVFNVVDQHLGAMAWNFQGPGLLAVDADGQDVRQLARMGLVTEISPGTSMRLGVNARFHSATANRDSDDIFVTEAYINDVTRDLGALNLLRVNTRTGVFTTFPRPSDTMGWNLDASNTPRAVYSVEKDKARVEYRASADAKWTLLKEFDRMTGEGGFQPVGFAPDGTLFVQVASGARGVYALHKFDFAKGAVDPTPVLSVEGFDVEARLIRSQGRLVGIRFETDAEGTVWLDPAYKDVQARIDKALPGRINRVEVAVRPEVPQVLVRSYSDSEPGTFALFNTETNKLTPLGRAMPAIDPRQMAQRDFVRLKARDGLEIPAWVTTPKGTPKGAKLPMVVLVHGGPWVKGGRWEWDADSQFLASRGYLVVEPEFRGSQGYGFAHFKAGWKQWGLAMQHDVADSARWAIAQGIADPQRICIAGASYGGYATLMGLVNDPDLFKCGINWVGVTDIELMYSVNWSDFSQAYKLYGMPTLVGDREKDAAQLKATSPLQQAERIRQPLLLAYGGLDRRVPIVHGVRFRDAVTKVNPQVEWVDYPEDGHGWFTLKTHVDFWTRVEKFLGKHIGLQRP